MEGVVIIMVSHINIITILIKSIFSIRMETPETILPSLYINCFYSELEGKMVLLESIFFRDNESNGLPRVFLGFCEFVPTCVHMCV